MVGSAEFRARLKRAVDGVGRKKIFMTEEISEGGLSKILNGEIRNPGLFTVASIAEAAGVSVSHLLGEDGHELSAQDRREMLAVAEDLRRAADRLVELFSTTYDKKPTTHATLYSTERLEESQVADGIALPPGVRGVDEGSDSDSGDLSKDRRRTQEGGGDEEEEEDRP